MKVYFTRFMLLCFLFLELSFTMPNTTETLLLQDGIKVELRTGFTIEDIIQDLHNNANITGVTAQGSGSVYVLSVSPKIASTSAVVLFLSSHQGVRSVSVNR